jgi:Glycosyltransferase family 87
MTKPLNRAWLIVFIITAAGVFVLKTWMAFKTDGAADISVWKDFLVHVKECGVCVYETGGLMQNPGGTRLNPFNHPPFIIHFLRAVDFVSIVTGLRFETAFRLITSLVDTGSAVVLYKLLQRDELLRPWSFLLYLLAPATIIISGHHGNTDTVMIFFVLLTALLIERPRAAGVAFGMALSIKIVPIIFAPVLLLYLNRNRRWFIAAAAATFLIASVPFLFESPIVIAREVLGYRGFPGRWGWTRALFSFTGPGDMFRLITRIAAYVLLGVIAYYAVRMNRRTKLPLSFQLGFTAFLFLAYMPAWGTNYMPWLDPFAVVLGFVPALLHYLVSGSLLTYLYFIKADESTSLMSICWIVVLLVWWLFIQRLKKYEMPGRR